MSFLIVRLLCLATLAFASPGGNRVKRGYGNSGATAGSFASSSSSSSSGAVGGGHSGSGGGGGSRPNNGPYANGGGGGNYFNGASAPSSSTGSSSAISSSSSGSYAGGGANGGGYGQNGYADSNTNSIPYGNGNQPYGSNYASNYPGSAGGNYYGNGGGGGGNLPFNLPQGCFSGFPNFDQDPYQIHQQIMNNIQRIHEENLRFGSSIANGQPQGNTASSYASGNIGPSGGYGVAGVAPPEPDGLNLRFGDVPQSGPPVQSISGNIPPPSGGTYGISTSSQSGSSTINGQTKTFKNSEVTVNDNGKVTTYKAHSP